MDTSEQIGHLMDLARDMATVTTTRAFSEEWCEAMESAQMKSEIIADDMGENPRAWTAVSKLSERG